MTLSVVIRDTKHDLIGAAVITHWFNSGVNVPWLRPGVGAVLTQGFTDRSFGWRGLDLMELGKAPDAALAEMLEADQLAERRQVVLVNVEGVASVHTGSACVPEAGHLIGDDWVVAGNVLRNDSVLDAMAEAAGRPGDLTQRLLTSLSAGEEAGGDLRGSQSAALRISALSGRPADEDWVEIAVADHPRPLGELTRLAGMEEAYRHLGEAMNIEAPAGTPIYRRVPEVTPEVSFWKAVGLAESGDYTSARRAWRSALGGNPNLGELLSRLVGVGAVSTETRTILEQPETMPANLEVEGDGDL